MKSTKPCLASALLLLIISGILPKTASVNPQQETFKSHSESSSCFSNPSMFIGNPAANYCSKVMGYEYQTITLEDGSQDGQCIMPDDEVCDQWAFYSGVCGAAYSYCAQEGMKIETYTDGKDPYSPAYGVCVGDSTRSEFNISDLIQFNTVDLETLKKNPKPGSTTPFVLSDQERASLPDHFDWRNIDGVNWMTPIRNQGACGSCWAFAAAALVESHYNLASDDPNLDVNLSEENLVSDCVMSGCDGGSTNRALTYIRDVGIVDEACMPYTATDSTCDSMCDMPERYLFDQVVSESYHLDVESLKYYVVNYGPVAVNFKALGSWDGDLLSCTTTSIYDVNHAAVVVGYDDAGQYWIVKNSWGTSYGDEGYIRVRYDQCNINNNYYAYIPITQGKLYTPLLIYTNSQTSIIPVLTTPSEGQIVNTLRPEISWELDDRLADGSLLYYQVSPDPYLHKYSGGINTFTTADSGSLILTQNLREGTTYYLHAAYRYYDVYQWVTGPYSDPITFKTGTGYSIPDVPVLLSPTNFSSLSGTNIVLDWEPVSYADYYQVRLWWYQGSTLYGAILTAYSDQMDVSYLMQPDTEYQWYLRGVNTSAWGEYTGVWTFTTGSQSSGITSRSAQIDDTEWVIMSEDGEIIPYEID